MIYWVLAVMVVALVLLSAEALAAAWLAFRVGVHVGRLQAQTEDAAKRIDQLESRNDDIEDKNVARTAALANRIDALEEVLVQVVTRQQEKLEAATRTLRVADTGAEVAVIQARSAADERRIRTRAAMTIVGAVALAALTLIMNALGVPVPHSWHL